MRSLTPQDIAAVSGGTFCFFFLKACKPKKPVCKPKPPVSCKPPKNPCEPTPEEPNEEPN